VQHLIVADAVRRDDDAQHQRHQAHDRGGDAVAGVRDEPDQADGEDKVGERVGDGLDFGERRGVGVQERRPDQEVPAERDQRRYRHHAVEGDPCADHGEQRSRGEQQYRQQEENVRAEIESVRPKEHPVQDQDAERPDDLLDRVAEDRQRHQGRRPVSRRRRRAAPRAPRTPREPRTPPRLAVSAQA